MGKKFYISFLVLMALTLLGCSKSEDMTVPEGLPATITFSLSSPKSEQVVTKGMTTSEEKNISRVFIMIFDSDDRLVASKEFTDIRTQMTMPAYSGNNMQFYAVTNYTTSAAAAGNPGLWSELSTVETLSDLNGIICNGTGMSATNPGLMTMVGNMTMTIHANDNNSVNIDLHYLSAKITVKFVDATSDQKVRFFGWEAHSLPRRGYLILRPQEDAVDHSDVADFYDIEGNNAWEKEEVTGSNHTVSQSFYMFENRPGPVSATFTNGYKDKARYAPEGASYLQASLSCVHDGTTYDIKTKVYLGKNNTDNYNVERSKHYTYTITISGVNSITVDVATDSNTEATHIPLSITTSSTLVFDAHPDQRIIRLGADAGDVQNVSIEVLNETSWLKISPLNMMAHQVRQSGDAGRWQQDGSTGSYVRPKFIPHHSVREQLGGAYTPPAGVTLTATGTGDGVNGLELADDDDVLPYNQATYRMCYKITDIPFNSDGTALFNFSLYSDEYDYIDGLTIRDAVIRIRYEDKNDNNTEKYVDLQVFQRQPMDFGEVVHSYTPTPNGSITYKHAVIEQIEESAIMIDPELYSVSSSLQENRQMQWGYNSTRLYISPSDYPAMDHYRNGYFLTANAVYGTGTTAWNGVYVTRNEAGDDVAWSGHENDYRSKRGSGFYNSAIIEPSPSGNSGSPYYIPTPVSTASNNKYYQPIYNSAAARYCHEKNRDINGDGKITSSETKWYLPSQHELYQLWISQEAVKSSTTEFGTGYYWSSTETSTTTISVIGFMTGHTENRGKNYYNDNKGNDVVRCIRKTDVTASPMVLPNRIIDCTALPSDAKTDITKGTAASGMLGDDGVSLFASTVFIKFQVAKTNAEINAPAAAGTAGETMNWSNAIGYRNPYNGSYPADPKLGNPGGTFKNINPSNEYMKGAPVNAQTGCRAYWEGSSDDPVTGIGKWRLPNKRELLLMWIYREQLEEQDDFTSFNPNNLSSVDFWSATERLAKNPHYVNMVNGESRNEAKGNLKRVRCIREILE